MVANSRTDQIRSLGRTMMRIRAFEEAVVRLYAAGKVPGFVHLSIGEEAVAAGVCAALTPGDWISSTHRGHAHCIAKGARLDRMMAELFGKKEGTCSGKGGSMHIADIAAGILGANGIVGGGIALAAGAAWAQLLKKTGGVTAVFFGDGATNTGSFHETANIAATWKLPLIFVCENNLFALSVPVEVHQNISSTASRAHGYEMRAEVVDGNDVLAVQDAAVSAVQLAREGMGPSFIECKTYRWRGHSEGDPLPPNLEEWKRRCPIARLKKAAAESGAADDAYWSKVEREVREEVSRAEDFAERSPFPSACEALEGVFATERSAACQ